MQLLIPFLMALGLVTSTQLNLLPYAYLSAPLPVSYHFQNTKTGEHAYSYAGGPSAKQEVKDADGVLRGSYSYIDGNGILQSVFYVADEDGFRVAATNLPTDEDANAETTHILLARSAETGERAKSSRGKRDTRDTGRNADQSERNVSDQSTVNGSSESASQSIGESEQKKPVLEETAKQDTLEKQQSKQTETRGDSKAEKQADTTKAVYEPVILTGGIPLATSHQSQVQVHNNARIDLTEGEEASSNGKPVELPTFLPVPTVLGGLPLLARLPSYHAIPLVAGKQDASILSIATKNAVPVITAAQSAVASATTTITSHGVSQIHGPSKISKEAVAFPSLIAKPFAIENQRTPVAASVIAEEAFPAIPIANEANLAAATATRSISSHGVSQIHGNSRIEPAVLVETSPIARLHPIVDVPVYLS